MDANTRWLLQKAEMAASDTEQIYEKETSRSEYTPSHINLLKPSGNFTYDQV
jgi:hypothetical protein